MVHNIVIPGIIIYIFVVPITIMIFINRQKNLINLYPHKAQMTKREKEIIEAFYLKFGFFFLGTKPD